MAVECHAMRANDIGGSFSGVVINLVHAVADRLVIWCHSAVQWTGGIACEIGIIARVASNPQFSDRTWHPEVCTSISIGAHNSSFAYSRPTDWMLLGFLVALSGVSLIHWKLDENLSWAGNERRMERRWKGTLLSSDLTCLPNNDMDWHRKDMKLLLLLYISRGSSGLYMRDQGM